MHLLVYIFIISFCHGGSLAQDDEQQNYTGTLRLASVFFRHGSRVPQYRARYPNDPYGNETFEQYGGWNQLTNFGKNLAFTLGENLRRRYDDFLGPYYKPDLARTTATDYDRVKMSALLVLAGLFPPEGSDQWNRFLGSEWQPIPYEYDKFYSDYFLRMAQYYCPEYARAYENAQNSTEAQAYWKSIANYTRYIEVNTGKPMKTLMDLFDIFNTLSAEEWMGLKLPEWTKKVYPEFLSSLALKKFQIQNSTPLLKKLSGGRYLERVVETMKGRVEGTLEEVTKLFLYSTHDYGVYNPLVALNIKDVKYPLYSWASIFELHQLRNRYYVKVFYQEGVDTVPVPMAIPNCKEPCYFQKFLSVTKKLIPENYTAECKSSFSLDDKVRFTENN